MFKIAPSIYCSSREKWLAQSDAYREQILKQAAEAENPPAARRKVVRLLSTLVEPWRK